MRKFRRRNQNSIRSAKFYRAQMDAHGRVILWNSKGPPLVQHSVSRSFAQKAFTVPFRKAQNGFTERLLCKAGSTKATLDVRVFVNRYLEMDSRAFFQWTEGGGRKNFYSRRTIMFPEYWDWFQSPASDSMNPAKIFRSTMGINKYFLLSLFENALLRIKS